MKHRVLPLLLVLALTLSPALAAQPDTGFSDVAEDDWFAPYVQVCVEGGLMQGVGDGQFAPGETLSSKESAVLALRLYDLGHGGDGTFAAAPAEWGYAALRFPDGTVREGYVNDETVWERRRTSRVGSSFGFALHTDEERTWGLAMDYQTVPLSLNGETYTVQLHLLWAQDQPVFLCVGLDEDVEDYVARWDTLNSALADAFRAPAPQQWWRDAWYYAYANDLALSLEAANDDRCFFAQRLAAVTHLPVLNDIHALPDEGDPDVLALYRAGVLTGTDAYGTFAGNKTLTRAEAAAICARILRPELRVEFSLLPLETYESYTLTYLQEDGERPGGPYRPMQSETLLIPDDHTLLRLDGVAFAAPEGYEFVTVDNDQAGLSAWDADARVTSYGFMDSQGQFREATQDEVYALPRHPDVEGLYNGYQSGLGNSIFYNAQGQQVTPAFAWHGVINDQGAGFVGLDRKIYRIEFEK